MFGVNLCIKSIACIIYFYMEIRIKNFKKQEFEIWIINYFIIIMLIFLCKKF